MKALLHQIFESSTDIFFVDELDNILNNVNERNLCGRLAIYMENLVKQNKISGYYADPEYNRKQNGQVKTILDDEMNVVSINCDIILHSRGKIVAQDNLIAIEMKKSNRPEEEKLSDKKRLRALTKDSYDDIWSFDGVTLPEHVCGYILGFYMEIDIKARSCLIECYQKGAKTHDWTRNF
ncbi:hypothetical protein [Maribellus maritimus]|uniref:hypothetical protein n=1 Tax=Maribellus maritimus TaxID=2870838 RepID=UPI001EEA262A|nr:hypothetical protein [Maribellus maritimus]MCG6191484.1 hypothetical protein [Maribellus maritimus]